MSILGYTKEKELIFMRILLKITALLFFVYFISACCSHEPCATHTPQETQFNPYAPSKYPNPRLNQNVW